jgi:hypothetical protein
LRAVIKNLDSRGVRERELKAKLKEAVEDTVGSGEKQDTDAGFDDAEVEDASNEPDRTDGDEAAFIEAKDAAKSLAEADADCQDGFSGIGRKVRVRQVIGEEKDLPVARYENGTVVAWKMRVDNPQKREAVDEEKLEHASNNIEFPLWKVSTERGHIFWLDGEELIAALARHKRFSVGQGYFENDSAFFSYRNSLGRFCGKATDAPYSSSPFFFAKLMIKREAEVYPKLKMRRYDNSWGGQSGARAQWTNSMKDYAYDFETVKQGLLTLENAIFDLTGQFSEYKDVEKAGDVELLLSDRNALFDIELESIEKNVPGLWNSPTCRDIFVHIVNQSKTTGVLALALDLLYRNTTKYMHTHKLLNVRTEVSSSDATSTRTTRRMNAWQQQQQEAWY